jgi:hypothetical protein
MAEDTTTADSSTEEAYIVALEDLFRVPESANVNSEEEAEQFVLDRIGSEGYIPKDATVVEVVDARP